MTVALEIPDELSRSLAEKWGDVPRHILESVVAEGYASGALTALELRRLLGHDSRMETLNFLTARGVWPRYEVEDLKQDIWKRLIACWDGDRCQRYQPVPLSRRSR